MERRSFPWLWVTWLTPFLAGDAQCAWSLWFRAQHRYEKRPSPRSGDLAKWKAEHAAMVRARAGSLEEAGYTVFVEGQNKFTLEGQVATLSGKPDIVAVKGPDALVVDCKTGERRDSDYHQVVAYLMAVPRSHHAVRDTTLNGEVQYPTASWMIPYHELTSTAIARISSLVRAAAEREAPRRVPSGEECGRCDIACCPDRVAEPEPVLAKDLF